MLVSFMIPAFLSAQNDVTFRVDMNNYSGSFTTVEVGGTFNGWCGNCAIMEDPDGDGIYELTVTGVPDGDMEFKFHVDNWNSQELFTGDEACVISINNGEFVNRITNVSGNTTLPVYCFNSCNDCSGPTETARVNFKVDMSQYTGSFNEVNLEGTFNNFCGGCAIMDDSDGDMIYELLVPVPTDSIDYIFAVDGFTDQEQFGIDASCVSVTVDGSNTFVNRTLEPAGDMDLDPVCWNYCETCPPVSVGEINANKAVSVFPNPSSGRVTFNAENVSVGTQLVITDITGKTVKTIQWNKGDLLEIDLNEQPQGTYFYQIRNNETAFTGKLVLVK